MKNSIIDRLIKIEEDAQSMSDDIREKEQNMPVLIQQKHNEIEQKLKAEYEEKTLLIKKQKEQETADKIAEIKRDSLKRYESLDEYYDQNHSKWEDEIISNITKR